MAASCTPWKKEQRASGRTVHVRSCANGNRAEIVSGDGYYTYNLYKGGRWVKRSSGKTLKATKSAASRAL